MEHLAGTLLMSLMIQIWRYVLSYEVTVIQWINSCQK